MADSPRRHLSIPIKGDRWRHQTVQGHISHPPRQRFHNRTVPGHVSASVRISPRAATPAQRLQQRKRRRVETERPTPIQSLIDLYNRRKAATAHFPPKIAPQHIRAAMNRYERFIQDACAGVEKSCASCGEFGSGLVAVDHNRLHSIGIGGVSIRLDDCGIADGSYQFCQACLDALNRGRVPKFSAMNAVNVTMCQDYPAELEDLTLMEEYVVARSHPIGTILKLKPNGITNQAAYNGIRGHIVTIPQDPGPLLDILPSPGLQCHDHIRVVWTGKTEPTVDDLKPFIGVRKEKVIRALLWLCEHNTLYKSVQINHELINQWAESFIPPVLQEAVVHTPEDRGDERGTYAGDMEGLSENDLHNALDDMADGTIASGVVYSDVEGERQNPELKMVMALMDMVNKPEESTSDADAQQAVEIPVITWVGDGRPVLMNDYEEPEYFTGAFPTLFPYGRGGHLPATNERGIAVSLEAWAKWLMNHHSRRYARHPTFMYLLYDVIQRRKSALGNSLLVKRGDYLKVQDVISSLTFQQLIDAAESLRSTQKTSDPAIATLRQAIHTVAARVPNSFAAKQEMRLHLRGLFVEFGAAAFWLTLNPSDLRDPLVVKLAGFTLPRDGFTRANAAFRRKSANMNPAAIAIFFDKVCSGILKELISPGEDGVGIFGEVSTYFGVVETNGRGMLHLHCLVWLAGNLDFLDLRGKMLNDPEFARRVIEYLDSIISEHIDPCESRDRLDEMPLPLTTDFEADQEYVNSLHKYGNAVASKRQIHSEKHNSTCFKYSKKGEQACRFYFPRPKVEASYVDGLGVAHLRRDNEWVNPYNPWIAAAIGSNQDLSFLATRAKALALLYYITNYATKDEASTYQMVMTAAVLRKTLEQAERSVDPSNAENLALEKGMLNFALRVFNRMSHDKEVSGVQVASSLLQLPTYYTPPAELHRINLYYLRRRLQALIVCSDDEEGRSEEQVAVHSRGNFHTSVFDDYKWRGSDLKDLCLYEYVKVVRKRATKHRTGSDIDFDVNHTEHGEKTQAICGPGDVTRIVTLAGQLSQHQHDEDRVRGGHPETLAMQNDLAAILLALFVPWEILPSLFNNVMSICGDECNADCDRSSHTGLQVCSIVWTRVKDTLPEHVQEFARNVEILRKSKEDVDVDMAERKAAASAMQVTFDPDLDDAEEVFDEPVQINGAIDDDTLRLSCNLIRGRWMKEDHITTAGIASLQQPWKDPPTLSVESFRPMVINSASGVRQDVSTETLTRWTSLIKNADLPTSDAHSAARLTQNTDSIDGDDNDECDSNADDEYAMLEPVLAFTEWTTHQPPIEELTRRLHRNPSPSTIADLITEVIPLNAKQKRTVSMIFYHLMRHQGKPAVEKDDQFLLYTGGEGGTGKSRIIQAVRLGMKILEREQEALVIAPTGNAAKLVQGSTIHTGLDIAIKRQRKRGASRRVRSLWTNKTTLIIDEISMVSLKLLTCIDEQCKIVKNLNSNSTAVFGGLPVVIVLGDFHQFPPVKAGALWQQPRNHDEERGQELWHMFKDVVLLDEQMRQQQDPDYHQLLKRIRNATVTQADVDLLNTRVVTQLESRPDQFSTCVVRTNRLRHAINRLQIERFARSRGQKIFIFPARHTRRKKAKRGRDLDVDKLLEMQDTSDVKGPGLLLYTKDMPTAVLSNVSTRLGIVNGALGKATGVVADPAAKFYSMDSLYVFCTLPPKCVLFEQASPTNAVFPGMGSTATPIFCSSGSVKIGNMSVTRHQVPVTPAWAITEYKAQGSTYDRVTLDLHWLSISRKDASSHRRYCSANVQLTRARSLQGLSLLQPVTLADLSGKPDKLLAIEDQRIAELATSTEAAWKEIESKAGFR